MFLLENFAAKVLYLLFRLSTIKYADQIIVLDKGIVAESGTFDDLMRRERGTFRKLVEKQAIDWHNGT